MKDSILARIKVLEELQNKYNEKLKEIEYQKAQILAEGLRMQGEYRGLKGLLDESAATAPVNGSQSVATANG